MENYLEKFKNAHDLEEIREVLERLREEELPPEMIIHPRVIVNKMIELGDIGEISEFIQILDETGYGPHWTDYITYGFFEDKIKESEDIGDIGNLLLTLLDIEYLDFWIAEDFTLSEILEKVKEPVDLRDTIRYYLGFLKAGHFELIEYLNDQITLANISSLLKRAEDLCDIVLITHFALTLKGKYPNLPFSEEELKGFVRDAPFSCITEFVYLSNNEGEKWKDLVLPLLKEVNIENEDFSEILDFYREVLNRLDYIKPRVRKIIDRFTVYILNKLKQKDIDLIQLKEGISLLHQILGGIDFIDGFSIWERFNKKWPSYAVASLISTLIDISYPISKIPRDMIYHYLNYYGLFPSFLYHMSELFQNIKRHGDRFIFFLRDMVQIAGEEKTLNGLLSLVPSRLLSTLGFIRSKIEMINDFAAYPEFVRGVIEKLSELSELEEFSSMLEDDEERRLFLSLVGPEKLKDFILSSLGLLDINVFMSRFYNFRDFFSHTLYTVLDNLTQEELEMIISLEDDPEQIEHFFDTIKEVFGERRYIFGKKIPYDLVLEKLYNLEDLEELIVILKLLMDMGLKREEIKGEFLRGFFIRDDVTLYTWWTASPFSEKNFKRENPDDDLLPEKDGGFVDEDILPEGYTYIFYPLLLFYSELKELGIDDEWIKGFDIHDIENILSNARIEYVVAFLDFLFHGGYDKKEILKLPPSIFIDIIKRKRRGTGSLFMKKRLLDVLFLWGYPMDWVGEFTPDEVIRLLKREEDLRDLDIFLLGMKRSGFSLSKIREVLYSPQFYDGQRIYPIPDIVRIYKALAILDIETPPELLNLGLEKFRFGDYVESKKIAFLSHGFPLIKVLKNFNVDALLENLIKENYVAFVKNDGYYKNFIRFLTFIEKEEYDIPLKKAFIAKPYKIRLVPNDEHPFFKFFDEDSLN